MEILTSPDTYRMEPEHAWRRLKMKARRPIELAALQALAAWREREAQSRNTPRGRVIKDDALYEIAAQVPTTREALAALRTIGNGFERSRAGHADHRADAGGFGDPARAVAEDFRRRRGGTMATRCGRSPQGAAEDDVGKPWCRAEGDRHGR